MICIVKNDLSIRSPLKKKNVPRISHNKKGHYTQQSGSEGWFAYAFDVYKYAQRGRVQGRTKITLKNKHVTAYRFTASALLYATWCKKQPESCGPRALDPQYTSSAIWTPHQKNLFYSVFSILIFLDSIFSVIVFLDSVLKVALH